MSEHQPQLVDYEVDPDGPQKKQVVIQFSSTKPNSIHMYMIWHIGKQNYKIHMHGTMMGSAARIAHMEGVVKRTSKDLVRKAFHKELVG
mmetsp:Transcript_4912/g.8986  ORF Transcript_4912/g.8986 Transcript_4912/m.8986 type:complete len:89 (-) Transcript_4912:230-496(-)